MINVIVPENDTQELWELNGRVKALRGYINREKKRDGEKAILYADEIDSIMGWDEECRSFGHPACEE